MGISPDQRFDLLRATPLYVPHQKHAATAREIERILSDPPITNRSASTPKKLRDAIRADIWRSLVSMEVRRSSASSTSLTNSQRLKQAWGFGGSY
jgi:hypothetical protein